MARYEGKSLVVMVENSDGVEGALTFVTGATVNDEYNAVQFEGDAEQSHLSGQLMAEVIVDYEYDSTSSTGNDAVLSGIFGSATPRFVRVQPIGTGAPKIEYAMDAVLLKYGPTGVQRGERVMGQATFASHANTTTTPAWAAQS